MLHNLLSAAPGISWPALPGPAASQLLTLSYQLEKSQFYTPEQLQFQQFRQLSELAQHAWETVPFYRDRLADAGYTPGEVLTRERWRALPLLTRSDIQNAGDALRSRRVPEQHGKVRSASTSGSTGQSLRVYGTELNNLLWMAYLLREHNWHKRDPSQKLAIIRYAGSSKNAAVPPEGKLSDSWGAPFKYLCSTGPSASLDISADTEIQMAWLKRQQPGYLLTYPSNLDALARYAIDHKLSVPGLREVRTISEIVTPELRTRCLQAFGVEITDTYSSNEAGYIAIECPHCRRYHVQAENLLCEILNESGEPCAPGETGRVVVTPLHNFAMPLLRYEIRDYAEVGDPGQCPIKLPTLNSILGRSRNMLKLPNGDTRWPSFLSWTELAPIAQYQIIQHTVHQLEAKLVTHRPLTAEDERTLSTALREQFGEPFDIEYTYLSTIRGHENGKFEVFISKVD